MFNAIKTKWLITIFAALLLLVILVLPKHDNKTNRSFKSDLADFDIENITALYIYPKNNGGLISLEKEGDAWKVINPEGESYNADNMQTENMLTTLNELTAKRLVSRGKEKWAHYQVNDSLGIRVQVLAGKKVVCDIYVGKFDYQQAQNPNPYSRQQGIMTSYVRLDGDKDVYAVDGFLSMTFGRKADEFRSRKIVQFDKNQATRFTFTTPESNYSLVKQDSLWLIDGIIADSAATANFISNIYNLQSGSFITEKDITTKEGAYKISIERHNIETPIVLQALVADTTNKYAITSSQNKGSYISGSNGMFEKLFISKDMLIHGVREEN